MSLDQLQTALDSKPLHEGLPEIFRDELRWPTGPTTTQTVKIANQNLAAKPIAQAAGVPVFLVHLPAGTDLPGVTGRREAHRSLGATFAEHMLIFVDHPGAACQFVWARAKGEKQPLKLAVLPYEQHGPARTTLERLDKLRLPIEEHGLVDILRRLEDAFSVEPLSKAFFTEISDLFFEVADGLAKQIGDENERRLFVQTLFNRLIFLRFVEKKGWLKGMGHGPNYLQALWQAGQDGVNPFWPTRLSALFTSLNHPKGDRVREVSKPLIGEVPYLNGGLFEDSPRFADPKLTIPPDVFRKLVGPNGLFYRYNFTVEESSPLDVQVAVDPEILGKIFEQLTLSAKRHDTGSYYTPREIVQFMCREAIVGYLSSSSEGSPGVPPVGPPDPASARSPAGTPGLLSGSPAGTPGLHPGPGVRLPEAKARALVYEHDDSTLTNQEGNLAFAALKAIKVVDPACGSGAYLLGMLQELYALFEILRRDDRKFSPDPAKEAHERKLWIIENNIYGVDLQAFATNTAMLRLWLTLLVEDSGKEPQPLPNLEYKIETGDSLLGPDPSQPIDWSKSQRGLDFESVHDTVESLRRLREGYQNAHGEDKIGVKKELETKLAELREKVTGAPTKDPARFDWRVEFFDVFLGPGGRGMGSGDGGSGSGEGSPISRTPNPAPQTPNPGFDVALANPPYVRADAQGKDIENTTQRELAIAKWKAYRKTLKEAPHFETLHEKWDLYIPFLERAHKMLARSGSMVFIISDSFNTAKYATRAHDYFVKNSTIERIDFCSEIPLFNAGVFNTILHFSRRPPTADHVPLRVRRRGDSPDDFDKLAEPLPSGPQGQLGARVFRTDIAEVEVSGDVVPLSEVCYISAGMVIHADERRAHLAFKAADLIQGKPDKTHPMRFFRGKDMERWRTPTPSFLEWGTNRAPALFRRPTFPDLYETPEKLISMDLAGGRPRVIYDDQQLFHNHSAWSFVPWHLLKGVRNASLRKTARYKGEAGRGQARMANHREQLEEVSTRFPIKYILGVMTSTPGAAWMAAHRKNKMHIFPDDWRDFPIPIASPEVYAVVESLVQKCLDAKAADAMTDVSAWEAKIDAIVERLYFG